MMSEDLSEDEIEVAIQAGVVAEEILSAVVADFTLDGRAHRGTSSIGTPCLAALLLRAASNRSNAGSWPCFRPTQPGVTRLPAAKLLAASANKAMFPPD